MSCRLVDILSEVMAEMKDMADSSALEEKHEDSAETNDQKVFERLRQALSSIAFSSPMGMVYVSK